MTEHEYRGYRIVPLGTWPAWRIRAKAQGTIPDSLHGEYTGVNDAKKAIDVSFSSLKRRNRKGTKNAKETSSPTS